MTEYCKLVAEKIGSLLDRIGQTAKLDPTVLLVQKLLPDARIWLDIDVNVNWPVKEMGEVKAVLKTFASNGIMLKKFEKSDTSPRWYLKNGEVFICLSPEFGRDEGASCKLVQVGTHKSEYPIYKLICTDKEFEDLTQQPEKVNHISDLQNEEVPF